MAIAPYYGGSYSGYPYNYPSTTSYPQPSYMPTQSYQSYQQPQQSMQSPVKSMEWVEGEIGAKAFTMPAGWPVNQPIPLWDSTEPYVYLKSWSQMGIPNPIKRLRLVDDDPQMLTSGQNGGNGNSNTCGTMQSGTSGEYTTKQDLEQFKNEIKEMLQQNHSQTNTVSSTSGNQNGSSGNNRGGSRNG